MAGKLCWALGLVLLFAAAVLTQAPLAVGLLGFFLLLTLLRKAGHHPTPVAHA